MREPSSSGLFWTTGGDGKRMEEDRGASFPVEASELRSDQEMMVSDTALDPSAGKSMWSMLKSTTKKSVMQLSTSVSTTATAAMQNVSNISENVHVQRATAQVVAAASNISSAAKDTTTQAYKGVEGAVKQISKGDYSAYTRMRGLAGMAARLQQMTGYSAATTIHADVSVRWVDNHKAGLQFLSLPLPMHLLDRPAISLLAKDQRDTGHVDPILLVRFHLHPRYRQILEQENRSMDGTAAQLSVVLGGLVSQAGNVLGSLGKEVSHLGKEFGKELVSDLYAGLKVNTISGQDPDDLNNKGFARVISVTFGHGRLGLRLCESDNKQYTAAIRDFPRVHSSEQFSEPNSNEQQSPDDGLPGPVETYNKQAKPSRRLLPGMCLLAANGRDLAGVVYERVVPSLKVMSRPITLLFALPLPQAPDKDCKRVHPQPHEDFRQTEEADLLGLNDFGESSKRSGEMCNSYNSLVDFGVEEGDLPSFAALDSFKAQLPSDAPQLSLVKKDAASDFLDPFEIPDPFDTLDPIQSQSDTVIADPFASLVASDSNADPVVAFPASCLTGTFWNQCESIDSAASAPGLLLEVDAAPGGHSDLIWDEVPAISAESEATEDGGEKLGVQPAATKEALDSGRIGSEYVEILTPSNEKNAGNNNTQRHLCAVPNFASVAKSDVRLLWRILSMGGNVLDLGRAQLVCSHWLSALSIAGANLSHRPNREDDASTTTTTSARAKSAAEIRHLWKWCVRYGGVPPSIRQAFWCSCAGVWTTAMPGAYRELVGEGRASSWEDNIQTDVRRTYGQRAPHRRARADLAHKQQQQKENACESPAHKERKVRRLANILRAMAATHSDIGYCQGMDYVCANLMRCTGADTDEDDHGDFAEPKGCASEEATFWLYSAMFNHYELRAMYEPGLERLKLCCYQFTRLLRSFLPKLHQHMTEQGVMVEMFVIGWFQTLFLYLDALPPEARNWIWDIFFFERSWKIFFRLALALMRLAELELLQRPIDSLMDYLNLFPDPEILEPRLLVRTALDIKVTRKMLSNLEKDLREAEKNKNQAKVAHHQ